MTDTERTVDLFVYEHGGWRQVAICSLASAEKSIERGTGRLLAVDCITRKRVAASREEDLNPSTPHRLIGQ